MPESENRFEQQVGEQVQVPGSVSAEPSAAPAGEEMLLDVTGCHTCAADSITSEPPSETLSNRQHLALEMVLAGQSDAKVAAAVGVSRRTVIRWRLEDDDFVAELRRRRHRLCDDAADQLRRLLGPSLDVLGQFIRSPHDLHRLRAASSVLRLARVGAMLARKQE
jgi:hypothetical protein